MLDIFNTLSPFFQDPHRRISVREYARMKRISPPTASKVLHNYVQEGLLKKEQDKLYLYFSAEKEAWLFIDLFRSYWKDIFERIGLLDQLKKDFKIPTVMLFGSFAKAEITEDSDIDIAVFSPSNLKRVYLPFEKKLGRKIQLFCYATRESVKSNDLLNNILSGYILIGGWQ